MDGSHSHSRRTLRGSTAGVRTVPGILVVDGGGIETMLSVGTGVEPLPSDVNPTFTIPGAQPQSAADRFGDMVDFAALSRYFDVPPRRAPGVLPRDAGARPTWTARVIDGRPALEVRATHITTGHGSERLVCELYPGILAMDRLAIYIVLTMGNAVEPLPIDSDERFAMRSDRPFLRPCSTASRCQERRGHGHHRNGLAGET